MSVLAAGSVEGTARLILVKPTGLSAGTSRHHGTPGRKSVDMQTFKGRTTLELVFSKSDLAKLARGCVVHLYAAQHYRQGCEVVACKLEDPHTRGYERLGYHIVESISPQQIRGSRKQIDKRTPAMRQASALLEQAQALLAQHSTKTSKGKGK
jgi:hypothetical protein